MKKIFITVILVLTLTCTIVMANSSQDILTEGYKAFEKGKYDEAIELFDLVLEKEPDCSDAWLYKGYSLSMEGKHKESLQCFEMVLNINPHDIEGLYGKGFSLFKQEYYKEAIIYFEKVLEIRPDYSSAQDYKEEALLLLDEKTPHLFYNERKNLREYFVKRKKGEVRL